MQVVRSMIDFYLISCSDCYNTDIVMSNYIIWFYVSPTI